MKAGDCVGFPYSKEAGARRSWRAGASTVVRGAEAGGVDSQVMFPRVGPRIERLFTSRQGPWIRAAGLVPLRSSAGKTCDCVRRANSRIRRMPGCIRSSGEYAVTHRIKAVARRAHQRRSALICKACVNPRKPCHDRARHWRYCRRCDRDRAFLLRGGAAGRRVRGAGGDAGEDRESAFRDGGIRATWGRAWPPNGRRPTAMRRRRAPRRAGAARRRNSTRGNTRRRLARARFGGAR